MNYCHSTIVRKLPTEIISTILEDCVSSSIDLESDKTTFQADILPVPLKLGQVCKSWNQIAFSTGTIWIKILISIALYDDLERLELLRNWMTRTNNLPLNISICILEQNSKLYAEDYDFNLHPQYLRVLELLGAFCDQWRDVYLQLPYALMEPLCRILRQLPNVERIRAALTWSEDDRDTTFERSPWTNFQVSPKHVSLAGYDLSLNAIDIRWNDVTSAQLRGYGGPKCLDLFNLAPALLSATLEDTVYHEDEVFSITDEVPIIQHTLIQHFSYRSDFDANIFYFLKFPNLTFLQFDCKQHVPLWVFSLHGFFTRSAFPLERLEILNTVFDSTLLCQLLHAVPSLQHLRLRFLSDAYAPDEAPDEFMHHLAETSSIDPQSSDSTRGQAFLPNLTTLQYEAFVLKPNFPWKIIPDIFGSAEQGLGTYRRPLTKLKVIVPENMGLNIEEARCMHISKRTLRKLTTIQQRGIEIIYETDKGANLLNPSTDLNCFMD